MKKIYLAMVLLQAFFIISSSYTVSADIGLSSENEGNDQLADSNEPDLVNDEPEEDPDEPEENHDEPEINSDNPEEIPHEPELKTDIAEEDPDESYSTESPIIKIVSIYPNPAEINEIITFIGSVENSSDDTIILTWDFGDFSEDQGETVIHSYSIKGTYDVTLSTTINNTIYQDSTEVVIEASSSMIDAGGPYSGKVKDIIFFRTSNNQKNNINNYNWNIW